MNECVCGLPEHHLICNQFQGDNSCCNGMTSKGYCRHASACHQPAAKSLRDEMSGITSLMQGQPAAERPECKCDSAVIEPEFSTEICGRCGGKPASSPQGDTDLRSDEYNTGNKELDLLLSLTVDMYSGRGNMDTALFWSAIVEQIVGQLAKGAQGED